MAACGVTWTSWSPGDELLSDGHATGLYWEPDDAAAGETPHMDE